MLENQENDEEIIEKRCRACWNSQLTTKVSAEFKKDHTALNILHFCFSSASQDTPIFEIPLCEQCISKIKEFKKFWVTCQNSSCFYNLGKNKLLDTVPLQIQNTDVVIKEIIIYEDDESSTNKENADETQVLENEYSISSTEVKDEIFNDSTKCNDDIDYDSDVENESETCAENKCVYCEKEFESTSDCQRHICNYGANQPISVDHEIIIKRPVMEKMNKNQLSENQCKICFIQCNSPDDLMDHSREYNHRLRNNCVIEPDGNTYKIYKCLYCPRSKFKSTNEYQRHLRHHLDGKDDISSDEKVFETRPKRIKANKKKLSENQCRVCLMEFNKLDELSDHTKEYNHILTNNSFVDFNGKTYKILKCLHCHKKTFNSVSDYQRHLNRHTGEKAHACEVCGQSFCDLASLKRHSFRHQSQRPYECPICNKDFIQKVSFKSHMKFTHHQQSIICNICKNAYASPYFLKKHLLERHKVDSSKPICNIEIKLYAEKYKLGNLYKCPECKEEFDSYATFKEHTSTYDENCIPSIVDKCNLEEIVEDVKTENEVTHKDNTHDEITKKRKRLPNQCELCDIVCESPEELNDHVKIYNHFRYAKRFRELNGAKRGYNIFKCLYCDRTKFLDPNQFKRHLEFHRGEKHNICDVCGKNYDSIGNLNRHRKLHQAVKPHVCEICGKGFVQRTQLETHKNCVHKQHKHICEVCGKVFAELAGVRKHKKIKHPEDQSKSSCSWKPDINNLHTSKYKVDNMYVCPICNEKFVNSVAFKAHARNTGAKVDLCEFCDKKFHSYSGLLKHYEKVHNYCKKQIFTEKCNYCDQEYRTIGGLQNHISKKHFLT